MLSNFRSQQSRFCSPPHRLIFLFYQLLGLEELSEVENLPRGQTEKATHGEEGEVEDTGVGRLIGVTHLLLKYPKTIVPGVSE